MAINPVHLRTSGLSEQLAPMEFGRALYHLAQHRHFKGRELEEESEEAALAPDESKARTEREATLNRIKRTHETLDEILAEKGPHERQRGIHANRDSVAAEFERLWTRQAAFHPGLATAGLRERVADTIFSQRPVFWRLATLGACRFMPGEELCPKGSWLSQQRRMLEKLNNLAITGGNARPLDEAERAAILEKLHGQASMTWPAVRTALRPIFKARGEEGRERTLRFNLEEGGDKTLLGNAVESKLAHIFGADWVRHPRRQAIRDTVPQLLWDADYGKIGTQRVVIRSEKERRLRRSEVAMSAIADFGATKAQADALAALQLPSGWEPYSTVALRLFMPHLEAGKRFGALVNGPDWAKWRAETFPDRDQPTGEILSRLPSPANKDERERIAGIRNPTVVRTQNEVRKVVNNLISVYGKPDLIRVEVARQVGASKRERDEIKDGQNRQARRREAAAKELRSKGIEPGRADIEKFLLWKEGQDQCPYTGDPISFDALFRTGDYEVEHIWPRSISFDDSFRNKTLCRRDVNLAKGNKTPFQHFEHRIDDWNAICNRLSKLVARKGAPGMSSGKVKRFLARTVPDDFASRQLNDTGYAARQTVEFLKRLWPDTGPTAPVTVQAVTGRVTAQLRRLWELNSILADDGEKTRADHRHHAIDALVVACTHPGITQQLSSYWQARDNPAAMRPRLDPPWANIRADAGRAVAEIVVSHRVRKRVSGSLHKEMPFGYTNSNVNKRGTEYGIYVKRLPVEDLSMDTLKTESVANMSRSVKFVVRDAAIRRILLEHLGKANCKPDKAYPPYPRVSPGGPEIRKVRVLTVKQEHLMVPASTGFADSASNHHIAIYRLDGLRVDFDVVTLFEASRRLARRGPIVQRERNDGASFIMSLSAGDSLQFPGGVQAVIWVVSSIKANGQVELDRATAATDSTRWWPTPGAILKAGGRKISVDPIGRIRPSND
jgi:CRISPR-associated endonuclease Csn1